MKVATELAWAAGFFDGEGCTYFGTRTNGRTDKPYRLVRIQVGQSEKTVLERFQKAVGVGRIEGPTSSPSRRQHKPVWKYAVDGLDNVQAVVLLLWPYLSEPKRAQIEEKFAQYRSYS